LTGFQVWNQANADASLASAGKAFHAYVLRPSRFTNQYTVVFDSGQLTMPALTDPLGEIATFGVANLEVQAGDRLAFYGQGIPLDDGTGTDSVYYPSPISPLQGEAVTLPSPDFPGYGTPRTYSFAATLAGGDSVEVVPGPGIRKFVDPLPTSPAATPETMTVNGVESDFYRIGLVEYTQQMHSDLPDTTKLRGYVQLDADGKAMGTPSYLGPAIVAQKDKPVR